jgi:hypothetical protein
VEGIADDQYEDLLVVQHDYALVCIVQDCLEAVQGGLVDFHSLGIELLASNFLVNTEIGVGMDPFYKRRAVVDEAKVAQDILA